MMQDRYKIIENRKKSLTAYRKYLKLLVEDNLITKLEAETLEMNFNTEQKEQQPIEKIIVTSKNKKEYYYLPTDSYGQPSGYITPITKEQYLSMKDKGYYVYDSYTAALYRAQA